MNDFPEYPFASHYLTLSDGLRLHYLDEQESGSDRPVLLFVHGNPTWSFLWRKAVLRFRHDFRCIAVDHIGCGFSDKPKEGEYPFSLERRIGDLCELIEHLHLRRITLIVHDWGGCIGMGAASRLPDRFERFVFMNTAAFRGLRMPLRILLCRLPYLGRFFVQGLNLFVAGLFWMAVARRRNLTPEIRRGFLAPYDSWHHRLAVYRFIKDIPFSPKHESYQTILNIEEHLPVFREKNVCLIFGMQDWCFSPDYLKKFLQFFPDASVHRLNHAHHLLLEDAPEEVLAALDAFLSGHRTT
ncbi:MAG: alpha/beta fold hydrolase [Planctomycetaceae bacterium]|nr:alpha/beta fold hydrolase [Planctomycetaceae bacterium]